MQLSRKAVPKMWRIFHPSFDQEVRCALWQDDLEGAVVYTILHGFPFVLRNMIMSGNKNCTVIMVCKFDQLCVWQRFGAPEMITSYIYLLASFYLCGFHWLFFIHTFFSIKDQHSGADQVREAILLWLYGLCSLFSIMFHSDLIYMAEQFNFVAEKWTDHRTFIWDKRS